MPSLKDVGLQRSILKTLAYSDIFDYPLTSREVTSFLISNTEVENKVVQEQLEILADNELICADGGLYFLRGRKKIVETRKQREMWSRQKWDIARREAKKLKLIPAIKMIGITGALAMGNTKEEDDIDLLIITSSNYLWLTRLLIILLCPILGIKRRKRGEKQTKDKICFNLFLEENHLKIQPENLFLAHEIVQVKPIYDKDNTHERFMEENLWVREYLPNSIDKSKLQSKNLAPRNFCEIQNFSSFIARCLNEFLYKLQFWYMKPEMTIEKVSRHKAFFHPNDLSDKIQKEFEERIKSLDKKGKIHL